LIRAAIFAIRAKSFLRSRKTLSGQAIEACPHSGRRPGRPDTAGSRSNAIGVLVAMLSWNDAESFSASGVMLRNDLAQIRKRNRDKCGC
jgi:hypothetical protein